MNNKYKNTVDLYGTYGGDKTHCLSAWCSTFDELDIEIPENIEDRVDIIFKYICKQKKKTPQELLNMLATHFHHTPFEKSLLHFTATTDIATHIQLLKHRIGVSINSQSARYKRLEYKDNFYVPLDWPEEEVKKHIQFCENCIDEYHRILKSLVPYFQEKGMDKISAIKRAKESARFKLPYSLQYTIDISFNFRSFYHFLGLRYSNHAQKEIKELAHKMLILVDKTNKFNKTLKSFQLYKPDGTLVDPFSTNGSLAS